jgi:mono/diheme cytochrome c family protein
MTTVTASAKSETGRVRAGVKLRAGEWAVLVGSAVIAAFALVVGVLIYLKPPPVLHRQVESAAGRAGEAVYRREACGSCHKISENGE